ncbi:MAG: Ran GAP Rna1 [Marteilia pararefringens]
MIASERKETILNEANKMQCFDQLPERIVEFLERNCDEVQEIYLSTNSMSLDACRKLSDLLRKCHKLKIIHLDSIFQKRKVEDAKAAMSLITTAIQDSGCHLQELNYRCNAFGSQAAPSCAQLFEDPNLLMSLQKIDMGDLGLSEMSSKVFANSFSHGFGKLKEMNQIEKCSIKIIELTVNKIRDDGAVDFCDAFSNNLPQLESFSIGANNIRNKGLAAVARFAATCSSLKVLVIEDNILGLESSKEFEKALIALKNLEKLDFADCAGSSECMEAILSGIYKSDSKFSIINISGNDINSSHLNLVKSIILTNSATLSTLDLRDTELSKKDIENLLGMLTEFPDSLKLTTDYEDIVLPSNDLIQKILNISSLSDIANLSQDSNQYFSTQARYAMNQLSDEEFVKYMINLIDCQKTASKILTNTRILFITILEKADVSLPHNDAIYQFCGLLKSEFDTYDEKFKESALELTLESILSKNNLVKTRFCSILKDLLLVRNVDNTSNTNILNLTNKLLGLNIL